MPDPISTAISVTAFAFSVASFSWQHLRATDSMTCTVISIEPNTASQPLEVKFLLSFANLGTRTVLLRGVVIHTFISPDYEGIAMWKTAITSGQVPATLKASEMCAITVQASWTLDYLCMAAKSAESRGAKAPELFFQIKANAWNPQGKPLDGSLNFAMLSFNPDESGWAFSGIRDQTFRLSKNFR